MTKQEKLTAVSTAYEWQAWDKEKQERRNGQEGQYIQSKGMTTEINQIQCDINDNGAGFDLSYEIMAKACDVVSQQDIEELAGDDGFYEAEEASVYTAERLSYLNIHNQQDISDKMKEYDCEDIQTACAYWYDEQVRSACEQLRDYILAE